jgi:hypothetical protein
MPCYAPMEVLTNDKEHAQRLLGIFRFGQEIGRKTERQGNFSRLVEIGFENMPKTIVLLA